MKSNLFIYLLLTTSLFFTLNAQKLITINGNQVLHSVHPMIQGHGLVYSFEADSIYADGSMAQLYQDIGASFLRWPGGTVVTHYHWNDLNGNGWSDSWDPNYNEANNADEAYYMDLDEYISLCNSTGVEPMLGINMSSGMEWNRQDDGLNEAVNLIKYCQNQNFEVQYFYLDNETYHGGNLYNKDPDDDNEAWTAATYAQQINMYADSIRKYNPNAKLIANWANKIRNNNSLLTLINNAGDNIDYIDIHWYWRWNEASWDLWKSQTPIQFDNQWYNGGTFVEEIAYFNSLTAQLNKPHIKIASLEWNIAPGPWQTDASHTKFRTALIQAEIQMQLIQGGMEIAAMWSTQWPNTNDASDRFLVDPDDGYTPNPTAKFYELYKNAINGQVVESSSEDNQIMTVVAIKDNKAIVFLLSKKDANQNVEFQLDGYSIVGVNQSVIFKEPGTIENITLWQENGTYSATVQANSLTMIEFELETVEQLIIQPVNSIVNGDFEENLSYWNTWNSVEISETEACLGNKALQLNGNSSANQWVPVNPSTSYTLSAFAKVENPSVGVVLGVTDYASKDIYNTDYAMHQITFTTTADQDSVKIYLWRPPNSVNEAYLDNVVLKETGYVLNPAFEMGSHAWDSWRTIDLETNLPAEGDKSLILIGNSSVNQWITLQPSTSYTINFLAKVEDAMVPLTFGVQKPDGNNYITAQVNSTSYTEYSVEFTTNDSDAKLFFWRAPNCIGNAYVDDIRINKNNPLKSATSSHKNEKPECNKTIEVWPNPANNVLNISGNLTGSVKISLNTISGRCMYTKSLQWNDNLIPIRVDQLPQGNYVLMIIDEFGYTSAKQIFIM